MTRRVAWRTATVTEIREETPTAHRIRLAVPDWPGNVAGQHLDVRLTAPDGYQASRSYSIASAGPGTIIDLAVAKLPDGEVSPFLVDELLVGDEIEIRGPLGGWFVWSPPEERTTAGRPVQLIGGGSGVVPLVSMVRSHAAAGDATPFRLLYSLRTPEDSFFADDVARAQRAPAPLSVRYVYTRTTPEGWPEPAGRIDRTLLKESVFPAEDRPLLFVCGSTAFVEQILDWLTALGHDPADIRAERFGGTR